LFRFPSLTFKSLTLIIGQHNTDHQQLLKVFA